MGSLAFFNFFDSVREVEGNQVYYHCPWWAGPALFVMAVCAFAVPTLKHRLRYGKKKVAEDKLDWFLFFGAHGTALMLLLCVPFQYFEYLKLDTERVEIGMGPWSDPSKLDIKFSDVQELGLAPASEAGRNDKENLFIFKMRAGVPKWTPYNGLIVDAKDDLMNYALKKGARPISRR